jgi:hypothetical protein
MTRAEHIEKVADHVDDVLLALSHLRNLGDDKPRGALEHAEALVRHADWIQHHAKHLRQLYAEGGKRRSAR